MEINWDTYHTRGLRTKHLYRYMTLERIIQLLDTKTIYFPRMDRFEDKLEGISIYDVTEILGNYRQLKPDFDWNHNWSEELIKHSKDKANWAIGRVKNRLKTTQLGHYVSCWYLADRESMAMWNLYSKEKGFAIKINRKLLQNSIKLFRHKQTFTSQITHMVAGRVEYQDFKKTFLNEKGSLRKYLAFRKDRSFEHEKEFRFILVARNSHENNPTECIFSLPVNLEKLEISIIAHPSISYTDFKTVQGIFKEKFPNIPLVYSELEPAYRLFQNIEL